MHIKRRCGPESQLASLLSGSQRSSVAGISPPASEVGRLINIQQETRLCEKWKASPISFWVVLIV